MIVIGAGAAGLAAAAELTRAGRLVLLLEARSRVGGRCLTLRHPLVDAPVELGAEFIHGRPESTVALLKKFRVGAAESTRTQRMRWGGRLRPVNAFTAAQAAMEGFQAGKDLSFQAYLQSRRLPPLTKTLATMMVQGFDAADPRRISAQSVAEEWASGEIGDSQARPRGGYGPLLDKLARSGARLQLQSVVREVAWRPGRVEVRGRHLGKPFVARADRAIVTLPLGVLQRRSVRFSPALDKRFALGKLASGPVIRVAMVFPERFWSPDVAFFHAPDAPFPTFWTPLPMRAPLLTAWAGGPKAARLAGKTPASLIALAHQTVEKVLKRTGDLTAAYVHDWQADPFARGGYSYVRVGGAGARESLAEPVAGTLFFAGEATSSEESGTVGGALASGRRAAREALG